MPRDLLIGTGGGIAADDRGRGTVYDELRRGIRGALPDVPVFSAEVRIASGCVNEHDFMIVSDVVVGVVAHEELPIVLVCHDIEIYLVRSSRTVSLGGNR